MGNYVIVTAVSNHTLSVSLGVKQLIVHHALLRVSWLIGWLGRCDVPGALLTSGHAAVWFSSEARI